jgi:hypothetical protein
MALLQQTRAGAKTLRAADGSEKFIPELRHSVEGLRVLAFYGWHSPADQSWACKGAAPSPTLEGMARPWLSLV